MRITNLAVAAIIVLGGVSAARTQSTGTPGPGVYDIDSLLNEHAMVKGQSFRTDVIAWDSASSVHLTQVETSIESHHHATHDENVWIIRGSGRLTLGDQKMKVKAGQVVHIPRGIKHAFHNLGSNPAVVMSVFSPGFDGKDRVYEDKTGK
jgi:mannose-6-phosphate isomerase-like protein (cupin superfamily)